MLLTYLNFQMYDSDYSYCHIPHLWWLDVTKSTFRWRPCATMESRITSTQLKCGWNTGATVLARDLETNVTPSVCRIYGKPGPLAVAFPILHLLSCGLQTTHAGYTTSNTGITPILRLLPCQWGYHNSTKTQMPHNL